MANPSHHMRVVRDDYSYTKAELCEIFNVSERTLNKMLDQLAVKPLFENTKYAQISGYVYNRAVARSQIEAHNQIRGDGET